MSRHTLRPAAAAAAALILTFACGGNAVARSPVCAPVELVDGPFFPLRLDGTLSDARPGEPLGQTVRGRDWRSGAGWWALVCSGPGAQCRFHATRLQVRNVVLPATDFDVPSGASQQLHWSPLPYGLDRVRPEGADDVPGAPVLIALFHATQRPAPAWLKAGPVTTWLHAGMPADAYAAPETPDWQRGRLAVVIPNGSAQPPLLVPGVASRTSSEIDWLELRDAGQRQRLPGYVHPSDGDPADAAMLSIHPSTYLRWAGDLDGDGRVEVLLAQGERLGPLLFVSSVRDSAAPPDSAIPGCDTTDRDVTGPLLGRSGIAAFRP